MSFGIESFKSSEFGRQVGAIIEDRENVVRMIALSEHQMPAVQAVGKRIAALGRPVSDDDKKTIGRWVREILEKAGWTTDGQKGRVSPGNLFSTGAIYHPKIPDFAPNTTTSAAMKEARAGGLPGYKSAAAFMSDLNADD